MIFKMTDFGERYPPTQTLCPGFSVGNLGMEFGEAALSGGDASNPGHNVHYVPGFEVRPFPRGGLSPGGYIKPVESPLWTGQRADVQRLTVSGRG